MLSRPASLLLIALLAIGCSGEADVDVEADGDTATGAAGGSATSRGGDTIEQPTTVLPGGTDSLGRSGGTQGTMERPVVTTDEQQRIDAWLVAYADSLNDYGDPEGTMYAGGTPLFNEAEGKPVSKYEYIVAKHPEKPWNQPLPEGRPARRATGDKASGGGDDAKRDESETESR